MAVKVAINGFGRIGRLVLRAMIESGRDDVVPVAINDLGSIEANAHLFDYDSVHGRFPGTVEVSGNELTISHGGRIWGPIKVSAERDPTKVPYQGVDVALECTGHLHQQGKGGGTDPGRRTQGADLGPGRRCGRDDRVRREPQDHDHAT